MIGEKSRIVNTKKKKVKDKEKGWGGGGGGGGGGGRKERIALHVAGLKVSGEGGGGRAKRRGDNRKVHPHMSLSGGLDDITANGENKSETGILTRKSFTPFALFFQHYFFASYPKILFWEPIETTRRRKWRRRRRRRRRKRTKCAITQIDNVTQVRHNVSVIEKWWNVVTFELIFKKEK